MAKGVFLDLVLTLVSIPLLFLYYVIYVAVTIIYRVFMLLVLIIQNLPLLLVFGGLIALGILWYGYHDEILTKADIFIRCDFAGWYEGQWKPLVNAAAEVWEQFVCWINALAHWNRFFTGYFLAIEFAQCSASAAEMTGGYYKTLKTIFVGVANAVKIVVVWLLTGLFNDVLPVYNIMDQFLPSIVQINLFFNCVCNDLRPIFDFAIRVVNDKALKCTIHYYVNAFLTIVQQLLTYSFKFIVELFVIIFGGGTFDDLVQFLLRQTTSLGLPDLTFATERALAGGLNFGMFLDNVLLIAGCTIKSEIDGNMDITLIYPDYESCYNNQLYHVPFFTTFFSSWAIVVFPNWNFPSVLTIISLLTSFTPTVGVGYRLIIVLYGLVINWFKEWDPAQQFLKNNIALDRLLDTIRDPPLRMNTTSTIWSILPDSGLIAEYAFLDLPMPTSINTTLLSLNAKNLYGDNYNGGLALNVSQTPSCILQYPSFNQTFTSVPCSECNTYGNFSIQYRLCKIGSTLDELVFGQTGASLLSNGDQRQIFQPILCCMVGRALRVGVAVVNYPLMLIRSWTDEPGFLEDDRYIHTIFDELGGSENQFGGIIQCAYNLFVFALEPRLRCFVGVVLYPAKAVSELVRSILLIFPRLVATIRGGSSQQTQNLQTYICLDSVNNKCFGIESAIQWLRPARQLPVADILTQFNATVIYQPILPPGDPLLVTDETAVDCLCNLLNLKFISDFLGFDILEGIDICCGFKAGVRAIFEAIKFLIQLVIVILQTFYDYTLPGNPEGDTFLFLEWIGCSSALLEPPIVGNVTTSNFYCSNLVAIASDLQDFLDCPCVFFLDLNLIIASKTGKPNEGFDCLCRLTSSIGKILLALIRFAISFVVGLLKAISCLIKEPPPTPTNPLSSFDCSTDLTNRFLESFSYINVALDNVADAFGAVGCIVGSLIGFATGGECLYVEEACGLPQPKCLVGDKLDDVLTDAASIVTDVLSAIIDILIKLLKAAITGDVASGSDAVPLSLVQFILDIVQAVALNLWGDQSLNPKTRGLLQHIGVFFNCVFGPPDCVLDCLDPFFCIATQTCSGSIFIKLGDQLRFIWGKPVFPNASGLSCIIFNTLFFLETVLLQTRTGACQQADASGNPFATAFDSPIDCSAFHIQQAIVCFFKLLFNVLFNNKYSIFSFILDIIGAILGLIPIIGGILKSIVNVIKIIVNAITSTIGSILKYLVCLFTSGDPFNNGVCDATSETKKRSVFEKDDESGSNLPNLFGSTVKDHVKKAKRAYFQNSQFPNFNATESGVIFNVSAVLLGLGSGSFCGRVFNRTILNNPEMLTNTTMWSTINWSPEEELLFKICYGSILAPYFYNAISRDYATDVASNPDSINNLLNLTGWKKRNVNQEDEPIIEYQLGTIPYDSLVNPISGITLVGNLVAGFGHYFSWIQRPYSRSIFDPTANTYTSSADVDDFSSPINITDPDQLEAILGGDYFPDINSNESFGKRRKRQIDYNSPHMIDDYLYQNVSFSEYLQYQGIDCHYTEAFFRSVDDMDMKSMALSLFNLRAGVAVTVSNLNTNSPFFKRALENANGVSQLSSFDKAKGQLARRIANITKSYAISFQRQYRAYSEIMKTVWSTDDRNIAEIMGLNGHEFVPFHVGSQHQKFSRPNLLGNVTTILGPKKDPDVERPPIFNIRKKDLYKRNAHLYGENEFEVRVPIMGMSYYLYRNIVKYAQLYVETGMNTLRENYNNRPRDHWSVFKKEYIYEKAINSPNPTSIEHMYTYFKDTATQRFYGGVSPKWELDAFMAQIRLGRQLSSKRFTQQANLGCKILDDFIDNTVSIFTYCGDRYIRFPNGSLEYNRTFTKGLPRLQSIPIDTAPYNASDPSSIVISFPFAGTIYNFFGYDIIQTIVNLFTNFNFDPRNGKIGIWYFLGHIPVFGICIRGVDDTCTYGVGLGKALLIGAILVGILIIFYILLPPIGNMTVNVVIFLGGFWFVLSIVLTLAYGYNVACLQPGGSTLLFGQIIPITLALPALPECAGADVSQFFEDLANSPCGLTDSLGSIVINGSCIACNSSGASIFGSSPDEFYNCKSFGFPTFTSVIANSIYDTVPSFTKWLNNTCLARGGCLTPSTRTNLANYELYNLPRVSGWLSFLIPTNEYVQSVTNTSSEFYQQHQACLTFLWPTRIAWYLILSVGIFVAGYIILPTIGTIIEGGAVMIYRTASLFYILAIRRSS